MPSIAYATHRDVAGPFAAELAADGFVDAREIGRDGFGGLSIGRRSITPPRRYHRMSSRLAQVG